MNETKTVDAAEEYLACVRAGRQCMALGLFEDLTIALMMADRRSEGEFDQLLGDVLDVYRAAVEAEKPGSDDEDAEDCNTYMLEERLRRVVRNSSHKRDFWKQLFRRLLDADSCARILGSRPIAKPV